MAQIKNGADKILIPAYKDMDPYDLPEEFSNLQAQDMSKLGFMQDLIRGVKKITQKDKKENVVIQVADKGHNDAENMVKRAYIALEDGDFQSANDFAEKALDKDAENAQAYIIQLLVELSLRKEADLEKHNIPLENYKNTYVLTVLLNRNIKTYCLNTIREVLKYISMKQKRKSI